MRKFYTKMTNNFAKKHNFFQKTALLGIPIALQSLLSFSTGFVNMLMVGRLGDGALSGVYMGNQVKILLTVFLCGVEGAVLSISAQSYGKGDTEKIKKTAGIGIIFVGAVSIMLTLVCFIFPAFTVRLFTNNREIVDTGADYLRILSLSFIPLSMTQVLLSALRSTETTGIGFIGSAISLLINTGLGYIFIFGKFGAPRLLERGAAIASVCAHSSEFIFLLIYTLCIDKKLKIRLRNLYTLFTCKRTQVAEFVKYGAPVILGQLLWGSNMLFASAVMGRQGKSAVSAMSIAGSLLNLSHVVTTGMAGALGIALGKAIGEGRYGDVKSNSRKAQLLFILLGALTSGFILIMKEPFISIYNISAEASREAGKFINVLAAVTVGTCYQSAALNGILKSAKDTRFVFGVELFAVLAVIIPLSLTAVRLSLTPWIIFAALKSDQFIKCIPAAIRVNRFKWLENKKARQ